MTRPHDLAGPVRTVTFKGSLVEDQARLLDLEWLVTNGLGGYASGSVACVPTRRFHSWLVSALPAPHGRTVMLNYLQDTLERAGGERAHLSGEPRVNEALGLRATYLEEFRLELGLPVWRFRFGSSVVEKRVVLVHWQNTAWITYTCLEGGEDLRLVLRPYVGFRPHEGPVAGPTDPYSLTVVGDRYEISDGLFPPLRLQVVGDDAKLTVASDTVGVNYGIEESRGYDHEGSLTSPGEFRATLKRGRPVALVASTEAWEAIDALSPADALGCDRARRHRLLASAHPGARTGVGAELVLAASQFVILPTTRVADATRANAVGDEVRTVIAGYPWFTDWGRDTMISLEGLTLATGRHADARNILRTFAHYVRDGLIPNMFPEGKKAGLYHTADASLWYFHAVDRYVAASGDRALLGALLPTLRRIADAHLSGTRFGIAVDPSDGLLRQGAEGYQLTWMDAKVDGWVVTPRRGKAVEINALFYNALRLLAGWVREGKGEGDVEAGRDDDGEASAAAYDRAADRVREAFGRRFWNEARQCLFDVVDSEEGDGSGNDPSVRPNQLLAISLPHPVLDPSRWAAVVDVCERELYTPIGLRSLSPKDPRFKARYFGDLRSRDAAYHQGTVWAWLLGPFVDAWRKARPGDKDGLKRIVGAVAAHLSEGCVGSVAEIFDAEPPFAPRGCFAQAWSVAEFLRCWIMLKDDA